MVLAALLGAVVAGLGGLLVPRIIALVPEPEPEPEPAPVPDVEAAVEAEGDDVRTVDEPPKVLYAEIAARPGLGRRSAVLAAVCGGLLGGVTGLDWPLVWLVPLTPLAVALSVIDWHTRLLPRVIVIPLTLAAIVAVTVVGLATGEREALVRALLGMVAARSFYWALWGIHSAGIGFGDVRLAAPVGLVLAWVGWGPLMIGLWAGFLAFSLPALVALVVRRDRKLLKKSFPFGPFMVIGALVGLVWGTALAGRIWG
ncbi:prepilin peptidase [Nocardioides astragali]|uniref:Prepilin peptidase n=1 Tax=Nocardioides astragali TaxID=1776736 RepID=A0ABW2NAW1_9ACTN|nr:A24 family peptidase [Nocardioides astragali]